LFVANKRDIGKHIVVGISKQTQTKETIEQFKDQKTHQRVGVKNFGYFGRIKWLMSNLI
jgi:hypothetical protein